VPAPFRIQRQAVLHIGDGAAETRPGKNRLDQRTEVSKHGGRHLGIPEFHQHAAKEAVNQDEPRAQGIGYRPPI